MSIELFLLIHKNRHDQVLHIILLEYEVEHYHLKSIVKNKRLSIT